MEAIQGVPKIEIAYFHHMEPRDVDENNTAISMCIYASKVIHQANQSGKPDDVLVNGASL